MATYSEEIERLSQITTQIKDKVETIAQNKKIEVESAVDTILTLLDKIDNYIPEPVLSKVIDRTIEQITAEDLQGATSIGQYAFNRCTNLTSITIPNSVTIIDDHAFSMCSNLASITIPESVTTIQNYAFGDCTNLKTITVKATTPPYLNTGNFPNVTTIYIPVGTLEAYSTATNWSNFADKFIEKDM